MQTFVILLRAIGPVTHRLMKMDQWRDASAEAGLANPQTYVSTGNMLVKARSANEVATVTANILRRFGLGENVVPIVRDIAALETLIAANRFLDAAADRPSQLTGIFAREPADFGWIGDLQSDVRIHVVDDRHLIVDYPDQVSVSRLAPGVIERRSKAVMTARNWNTLVALAQRATERTS